MNPQLTALFQIGLDLVLIGALALVVLRRPKAISGGAELIRSLEKVIEETNQISADFEANLKRREELIQSMIAGLDRRLEEAEIARRQLEKQLERVKTAATAIPEPVAAPPPVEPAAPSKTAAEHFKIAQMAQRGLSPEEIAKRLQKPLGEVRLILNLRRLSTE